MSGHVMVEAGRIGPNAILQCMSVLQVVFGRARRDELMRLAGLGRHLDDPPRTMIDERDVQVLHQTLRAQLGTRTARSVARRAGLATGDYLLANRIPRPARWLLPHLPSGVAARVLLAAVSKHAWTFCGSGVFRVLPPSDGRPWRVSLTGSATSVDATSDEPLCDYFAATFERLFQVLVHPATRVVETECMAMGAPACVFELDWSGAAREAGSAVGTI